VVKVSFGNGGLGRILTMKITEYKLSSPIVTFYSHKGGVGRTTALAAFAAFYATHYGKKVVMIDCDFEAPGFANFFDLAHAPPTNGTVEYLLDRLFAGDEVKLKPYAIQISKEYAGKGELHVILAGNLSEETSIPDAPKYGTHFRHYLESLARLNVSGTEQIVEQMTDLLKDVRKEINPDVILIDTRNGINDIFGNLGLPLSSLIVGFFANDYQTIPGLNFFLRIALKSEFTSIVVNSLIPEQRVFEKFQQRVNLYIEQKATDKSKIANIKMSSIMRDAQLEQLGTAGDKNTFLNLIKESSNYRPFFEMVIAQLNVIKNRQRR